MEGHHSCYVEKHEKSWFQARVGKRVFRTEASCQCEVCKTVGRVGLVIADEFHAQYLFDCQNELGLYYFDEQPNVQNDDENAQPNVQY